MKIKLNSEDLLRFAIAAKSVFRTLDIVDSTFTYKQFVEAIGLKVATEPWLPCYRQQGSSVKKLLAAVERLAHEKESSFWRIVNADTGQPGAGLYYESKIVSVKPEAPEAS